ncbi:LysR family transcriptional regulator [Chromobacterium sp. IIBBL 290-4]|uniref:LysR family transcriptional regulator n=1 Tax=Chromobacterium sp. IIBBL 290-4 TaxID=2953890 RepID=UPI0020B8CB80|nr:LysR family transcriptional regulator [Chromobacterium sp. IIBBL 290-4]UTH73593.1 LysR family transcriptional regulator [Chromobacterium sp. IIBBL 290-4]
METMSGLKLFALAAETRSFVEAGRQLGISSSAVGKSVARLEEKLGVRLFHRSTRSITLTIEGQVFLARCRRILAEIDAAEQELQSLSQAPRGRLRLSLPVVGELLNPLLAGFAARYPDIELELDFSDRVVDVIEEGFDAVIRIGELRDSRLQARRLGAFRLILAASPAYLAQMGEPASPVDLPRHRCLHYRFPSSGKTQAWPLAGLPELPQTLVCNTVDTLVYLATQGLGICCVPDFAARPALESGQLRVVLADASRHDGAFHLLWPAGRHPAPRLRAFIDYLAAQPLPSA